MKATSASTAPYSKRWVVLTLLFAAAVINYIDRQNLSVAAPVLRQVFDLSATDYSKIVLSFMLAYAIMHPVGGWLVDRIGTRAGLSVAVVWWSLACIAHGWATGMASLVIYRFLLGMGEAAFLPASVKAISEWFPKAQRALAVGLINVGIGVGAVLAPPLVTWLILVSSWQMAFVVTGALGFLWLGGWLVLYRTPPPIASDPTRRHRSTSSEEPDQGIVAAANVALKGKAGFQGGSEAQAGPPLRWRMLRHREMWALMAARFLADPVWYFYLFWLPEYLSKARGFSLAEIGLFAWIPFVAAIVGNLAGGWIPGRLIRKGWSLTQARKGMMAGSAFLVPVAILAAFVQSPGVAIALITLAVFLIWIWATTLFTLPADLFPSRVVALAFGLSGAAGSFGAVLFMPVVGLLVDHFSYTPIFVIVGLLHPIAATILLVFIPRVEVLKGWEEPRNA